MYVVKCRTENLRVTLLNMNFNIHWGSQVGTLTSLHLIFNMCECFRLPHEHCEYFTTLPPIPNIELASFSSCVGELVSAI